MVRRSWCTKIP